MKNEFCSLELLTNEASVEEWFISPLLQYLEYSPSDIALKTSIQELKVGKGSKLSLYKPDYILSIDGIPVLVIDAKSPNENPAKWEQQGSSYCLELNKRFDYDPVQYYIISNGVATIVYKWNIGYPLLELHFSDFVKGNSKYEELKQLIGFQQLESNFNQLRGVFESNYFNFHKIPLSDLTQLFQRIHQQIWKKETMSPSAAFEELMKVIFVKIQKDKELYRKLGKHPKPTYKDVVFSTHWIASQTENKSPINDPLFRNLINSLENEIESGKKKRFLNREEQINLNPETVHWIVKEIEHIDFFGMEDDIHGRMFESFLDATVRGRELGQFFTPRDIVNLMVGLANIDVSKAHIDNILDACCGSGGFLIAAMNDMNDKVRKIVGLSNVEREDLSKKINNQCLYGIDAGSNPPIYRIARMNMYLHGDGGSNIFFADALDKTFGLVGKLSSEDIRQRDELRRIIVDGKKQFDIILSNPPFSMAYNREDTYHKQVLSQYDVAIDKTEGKTLQNLLSSVMFLERYRDLISENGKILAIVDESILSGDSYKHIRNFIRENFIIMGVISLPGDAFSRASARVKTSILILRRKKSGEIQSDVFMASTLYVGIEDKVAKRINIDKRDLPLEKRNEISNIIKQFENFTNGIPGEYVVPASRIADRLDVKFCIGDRGRKRQYWVEQGFIVVPIGKHLVPQERKVKVNPEDNYQFLRVTYDGDVVEGDLISGEDSSYNWLYIVNTWDILLSNMGVGRGAVGLVPPYHNGKYVSNEYTILRAKSNEEAVYYANLIRTKEILGDILTTTTGMNRGRIQWKTIADVEVPEYDDNNVEIHKMTIDLKELWQALDKYMVSKKLHLSNIENILKVNDQDAHRRWLAYKPPE